MDSLDKSALRPTRLERIYDVVIAAGIDVSAWHKGKGDYSSNPHFCYRWAFEGETTALLCLWLPSIERIHEEWVCKGNARTRQMEREAAGADHWDQAVRNRTKRWAKSAIQFDDVLKQAYRKKLVVRVCIIDTLNWTTELETKSADFRGLDPMPWQLSYDMMTGDYSVIRATESSSTHVLKELQARDTAVVPVGHEASDASDASDARTPVLEGEAGHNLPHESYPAPALPEITPTSYGVGVVDQCVIDEVARGPASVLRFERERSAVVRQLVMARSQGRCEWCGQPGFIKHDGQIYLESHHVVPLHQDGDDTVENVIALCPNDHRLAHYGANRDVLAIEMLIRVEDRIKVQVGAIKEESCF